MFETTNQVEVSWTSDLRYKPQSRNSVLGGDSEILIVHLGRQTSSCSAAPQLRLQWTNWFHQGGAPPSDVNVGL